MTATNTKQCSVRLPHQGFRGADDGWAPKAVAAWTATRPQKAPTFGQLAEDREARFGRNGLAKARWASSQYTFSREAPLAQREGHPLRGEGGGRGTGPPGAQALADASPAEGSAIRNPRSLGRERRVGGRFPRRKGIGLRGGKALHSGATSDRTKTQVVVNLRERGGRVSC